MKKKYFGVLTCILMLMVSCGKEEVKIDKNEIDKKEIAKQEIIASLHEVVVESFYCSVNCEDGRLYDRRGNCPVCRMDLMKK